MNYVIVTKSFHIIWIPFIKQRVRFLKNHKGWGARYSNKNGGIYIGGLSIVGEGLSDDALR